MLTRIPNRNRIFIAALVLLLFAPMGHAQTTSFTYQGRVTDGGTAANGNYDLQFALFDGSAGGTQIGATQTVSTVAVSAGIFSVQLDFGATAFPGANRFLEISARVPGAASFTTLSPRQQITSTPYAIRSLNALTAEAVTVSGVPSGNGNYIQNNPASQQAGNFNISGNGTAGGTLSGNIINATTQYNVNNRRVLSIAGVSNVFVGDDAGIRNTSGEGNAFSGYSAGLINSSGNRNSFFGAAAGLNNAVSSDNSFFGYAAGLSNAEGGGNSFFGSNAGLESSSGSFNSFFGFETGSKNGAGEANAFFGFQAGRANTGNSNSFIGFQAGLSTNSGVNNSFIGNQAGRSNNNGNNNTFVGRLTGLSNVSGSNNTLLGHLAAVGATNLTNATAIGADAQVNQSNSMVLGSIAGVNNAPTSVNVGIGTTTPAARLDVNGSFMGRGGATITGTNGDGAVLTARRSGGDPYVIIDATTVSQSSVLAYRKNNLNRWLAFADNTAEGGGNAGSDFRLDAYNDAGGGIATYLFVKRSTGNVGIGTTAPSAKLNVKGPGSANILRVENSAGQDALLVSEDRTVAIGLLSTSASAEHVCKDFLNRLSFCSSSLRFKENVAPFSLGLELVRRLRPISFTWKNNGTPDLGLGAEDVAKVEPLLVTYNNENVIQGVKYDQLNVILINAVKQQQEQIEALRTANAALNARLLSVENTVRKRVASGRLQRRNVR